MVIQRGRRSIRGSILVLVAIVIVALLGIVALVVDIGISLDAKHELKGTTQHAALGALSAYLDYLREDEHSSDYSGAAAAGLARAGDVVTANKMMLRGFLKQASDLSNIKLREPGGVPPEECDCDGQLELGRYHWVAPTGDEDPCSGEYPCFEPLAADQRANAARLTLVLRESTALRTRFAGVLGVSEVDLQEEAIATFIPRNDAIMVDLSASTGADYHKIFGQRYSTVEKPECHSFPLPQDPACFYSGTRAIYSYPLPGYSGVGICGNNQPYDPSCEGEVATSIAAGGAFYTNLWDQVCASRPVSDPCVQETADFHDTTWHDNADPRVHTKDDYVFHALNYGVNLVTGVSAPAPQWMLVDHGSARPASEDCADGAIEGPCTEASPLQAILLSVNRAMEILKDRSVPSDGFFLSGFDQDLWELRSTCDAAFGSCTSDSSKFVAPSSNVFESFLAATSLDDPDHADDHIFRGLISTPRNTDIIGSIWYAYLEMRKQPTFSVAKNSIWIFTDAAANCCFDEGDGTCDPARSAKSSKLADWFTGTRICRTDDSHIYSALSQIPKSILNTDTGSLTLLEELVHNRVSVNVVMVGEQVRPHQIVRRKPAYLEPGGQPQGCLTLQEAELYGEGFVDWGSSMTPLERNVFFSATLNSMPGAFYPIPNRIYEDIVMPTRGAWIPIYPVLRNKMTGAPIKFDEKLKACCNAESQPGGIVSAIDICTVPVGFGSPVTVVDSAGRLLYDPLGRSQLEQMREAMETYMFSPYTLVEAE